MHGKNRFPRYAVPCIEGPAPGLRKPIGYPTFRVYTRLEARRRLRQDAVRGGCCTHSENGTTKGTLNTETNAVADAVTVQPSPAVPVLERGSGAVNSESESPSASETILVKTSYPTQHTIGSVARPNQAL